MRLAANLSMMFDELPFLDRFAAARAAGFEAVEFLFPYAFDAREIAARLQGEGLEQVLFNLPPGDWEAGERGLAALPEREAEFREGVARAADYAAALGCRTLHAMAGIGGDDAVYRENLAFAADALGDLTLTVEPINPVDMPGYHLAEMDVGAALVAEMDLPNLRLQFDLYHCHRIHGEVADRIARHAPLVAHWQVAGFSGRNEPGPDEIALIVAAARATPDLAMGCEYRPAGATGAGLGWLDAARQAMP